MGEKTQLGFFSCVVVVFRSYIAQLMVTAAQKADKHTLRLFGLLGRGTPGLAHRWFVERFTRAVLVLTSWTES